MSDVMKRETPAELVTRFLFFLEPWEGWLSLGIFKQTEQITDRALQPVWTEPDYYEELQIFGFWPTTVLADFKQTQQSADGISSSK